MAESSLNEDRGKNRELYAESSIADYWIVNLLARTIEVYRQPENNTYQWMQIFGQGEAVAPLCLPAANLPVDYLFVND